MAVVSRVYAVDWSGDRVHAARKIWLAESRHGELVRLENGRSREAIADLFTEEAKRDPRFIVGFDFAFSFPLWFCERLKAKSVDAVWRHVVVECEQWVADCPLPFWGRRGTTCPPVSQQFRMTEREVTSRVTGARPKSVFQIAGPGAVGIGSLRGMPILPALQEAGFSIWPFSRPGWPRVIEIYPRALTGPVNKSSHEKRLQYLVDRFPRLSARHRADTTSCEDAFDAAVSALVMHQHLDELVHLGQATKPCDLLEGRIWYPGSPTRAPL